MKIIRKYGWLLAFVLFSFPAGAQLIRVSSHVSSDSMMIGDQLKYTLRVDAAANVEFRMPVLRDTLGGGLEILAPVSADTAMTDGRTIVDHCYLITGFEPGSQRVPPVPVEYTFNGTVDTALSMPAFILVNAPEVDPEGKIKDIKPPINTPLTLREIMPWVALGAGIWLVGTFLGALVWMYRQRKKDPEIFSIKPQEPAHVLAFRELDALKEQKLWESGRVKDFYTRLTEITRQYIERQYGIPAMERTSGEILEAFRRSNTDDPLLDDMLRDLLELADLVKFAKEDPQPVENQTNLNYAYLFVQKTYPLFYMTQIEDLEEETAETGKEEVRESS
jgi:hypothetical protein